MVVAVEGVGAVVGDEEVGVAVGIVVCGGNAKAVAGVGAAAVGGDVGEGARACVAIEAVDRRWVRGMAGQIGAVGEIEVEAAIAVVVEKGGSSAEGFDIVVFAGKAVVVDEVDASGGSGVGEMHWRCWGVLGGAGAEEADEGETPYWYLESDTRTCRLRDLCYF